MLLDLINDDILFKQLGSQAGPLKQIFHDILGPVDATLSATRRDNATLREEVNQLRVALSTIASPNTHIDARVPELFTGEAGKVEVLLMATRTYFSLKPGALPDERTKIIWVLQFFAEKAEPWARGKLEQMHDPSTSDPYPSYATFESDVRVTFGATSRALEARNQVLSMTPDEAESLGEFLCRFRPEADASNLGDVGLIHRLRQCLYVETQTQVIMLNAGKEPERLSDWYKALHTIDGSRTTSKAISATTPAPIADPMPVIDPPCNPLIEESHVQMPITLTPERKAFLRGLAGEMMQGIRVRQRQIPGPQGVSTCNRFTALESNTDKVAREMAAAPALHTAREGITAAPDQESETLPFILVRSCGSRRRSTKLKLQLESIDSHRPLDAEGLLDTGATGLFIDEPYVDEMKFTRSKLPRSIPVYNIDGTLNENGSVKEYVDLIVRFGDHTERARFYITALGGDMLVIGHPWLVHHNPEINWTTGEIRMSRCPSECRIRHIQAQRKHRQRYRERRRTKAKEPALKRPLLADDRNEDDDEDEELQPHKAHDSDPDVPTTGDRIYTCIMQPDPAYIRASSTVSQRLAEASEKHRVQK